MIIELSRSTSFVKNRKITSRYSKERQTQLLTLFVYLFLTRLISKEVEKEQSKKNMTYGLSSLMTEGAIGVKNITYLRKEIYIE